MFETHTLNESGLAKVKQIKRIMADASGLAMAYVPEGREKALFKTKLEEAMFFATKAVAADPANHTAIIRYETHHQ